MKGRLFLLPESTAHFNCFTFSKKYRILFHFSLSLSLSLYFLISHSLTLTYTLSFLSLSLPKSSTGKLTQKEEDPHHYLKIKSKKQKRMFFGGGSPFDDMPGGGSGRGGRGRGPVENSKLYEVLGVPKDAEEADIRKAYRKLALKNHPDKGGDVEKVLAHLHFLFF